MSSGKTVNDLGAYEYCIKEKDLNYALVLVKTDDEEHIGTGVEFKFGLCIPKICTKESLTFLNNFYTTGLIMKNLARKTKTPEYIFPEDE